MSVYPATRSHSARSHVFRSILALPPSVRFTQLAGREALGELVAVDLTGVETLDARAAGPVVALQAGSHHHAVPDAAETADDDRRGDGHRGGPPGEERLAPSGHPAVQPQCRCGAHPEADQEPDPAEAHGLEA